MSTIKVNTITTESGSTITLGESGKTVSIACGASTTGMGRTGTVDWVTTIQTSTPFTGVTGKGYFVNTTSGAITCNLPAGTVGDIVAFKDYANTWDTNNVTLTPNGTDKINGTNANSTLNTESQSVTLIYTDATKGWQDIHDSTSNVSGQSYLSASGGTETDSGDYKIHTFTADGTFTVSSIGSGVTAGKVDYIVVAGGGSGAANGGSYDGTGAGGGGGFREAHCSSVSGPYTASP